MFPVLKRCHSHFDHILNAKKYKDLTGGKIVISEDEKEFLSDGYLNMSERFLRSGTLKSFKPDILVKDGDFLHFGDKK